MSGGATGGTACRGAWGVGVAAGRGAVGAGNGGGGGGGSFSRFVRLLLLLRALSRGGVVASVPRTLSMSAISASWSRKAIIWTQGASWSGSLGGRGGGRLGPASSTWAITGTGQGARADLGRDVAFALKKAVDMHVVELLPCTAL